MKKEKTKALRICYAGKSILHAMVMIAMLALLLSPPAWAARTQLKPGWNMFSPQQDIEMGQQASVEAEKQVPMMNNSRVDNYLNNLGKKLSAHTPGYKYPYTYKCVNDRTFNAFALPGGHIYINRGVIEAAANEAQLAGVIAHETSHVALRHGTNQATKASAAQVPLAILGGLLGSDSTGAVLAKLGANFTVNSVLLKYSRTDESEADVMATQILYDSGYDPRAMGQFFQKMQAEDKGGNTIEFFNSHPDTENRLKLVDQEVSNLGGLPRGSKTDSKEFQEIKRYVLPLQASGKGSQQNLQGGTGSSGSTIPYERPSDRVKSFQNSILRIEYPDNWKPYGQGDAVTIAPSSGLIDDGYGRKALAYGVLVNVYVPPFVNRQYQQQLQPEGYGQPQKISLEDATDRLIQDLRQSNQKMILIRNQGDIRVAGERAMSIYLSNESPMGGRETNWLVTLPHTGGLLFIVFTAPEQSFQGYESTFQKMLRSVQVIR